MNKPTLCVINFNGRKILPVSMPAAYAIRDRFAEIVVIDNGSDDGSLDLLANEYGEARVVRLPHNLGAGGARNAGLREARTDLILFIDNDVALTADCVEHLVDAMRANPQAAFAAAAIVYAHRRDIIQYDGAECHFMGMQTLLDEDVPIDTVDRAVRKVGSMSTCCFMADRSRIPRGEYFDEAFFYMFEDHDYGVRVRVLGAEVLSVPAALCYHGMGTEGLSIRALGTYSNKRVLYLIRNRWLFLLKNYSARTLIVLAPLFAVYETAQFALVLKKGWLPQWWQSVRWVFSHLPSVLADRRRIQRARKIPDRQILIGGRIPFRRELTAGTLEKAALGFLDAVAVGYWKLAGKLV